MSYLLNLNNMNLNNESGYRATDVEQSVQLDGCLV